MRRNSLAFAGAFTPALLLGIAVAEDPAPKASLREIADSFATSGDLDGALATLKKEKATPAELLKALRTPVRPPSDPTAGSHSIDLTDGDGRSTDLFVAAPTAEQIKAHAGKGLGLVVCLHGLGGSSRQAHAIAEKLAARGDVVAVAPSAKPVPERELSDTDGIPDLFKARHWWMYDHPRSFPLEAIQKARALYPIDVDRVVLTGMSMGGYGTWNIGLRRPDRFAGLAPLAGGISYFAVRSDRDKVSRELLENGRLTPVLSIHGTADSVVPYRPDKEACDELAALGGKVELRSLPGVNHDLLGIHQGRGENGEYLVKWLAEQRRNATPETVTYVSLSDRLDGSYWLRVVARSSGAKEARVEGKVDRAKNRIVIAGKGADLVRVYVDDRLLDLSKPVSIAVGTSTRARKKLEPDFRAILESWRSRRDEQLVYPAFVEVDPRAVQ